MSKKGEAKIRKEKVIKVVDSILATLSGRVHLIEKHLLSDSQASVRIDPPEIRETAKTIKDNLEGVIGETVIGVDLLNNRYELIYYFWSLTKKVLIEVRTRVEGTKPSIDSVFDIFPGLDWHEREVHEMFGVKFNGHPNLSLLILPDELEKAYPLRKSYQVSRDRLKESGIFTPPPKPTKQSASSADSAAGVGNNTSTN